MAEKAEKTGRPAGFKRQTAVSAAMGLFWKKGFLSVSAKELAEAMSIQRSSFYNSFGSREALLREVLQVYGSQSPDAVLDQVQEGDAVMPVFIAMLRTLCRIRAADKEGRGCLVCNGVAELVGVEEEVGPLFEQAVKHRTRVIERLLRQAVQQGEIPPLDDPAVTANEFIAFLLGLNVLSKVVRDERQLWASCRQFLLGLGADQTTVDQDS
jgi:TetR/AcrR family transcriptional repressor of nem operon